MSKIARATMAIFGSSASLNQIEQFGSLAAGSPVYLTPGAAAIASIQALSNYLEGWFGGVVGSNAPAIQDLNALCYLYAYQIAYGFQAGIPEWDSGTTYYTGSFAAGVGTGVLYRSLIDNNTNNAVTTVADWAPVGSENTDSLTGSGTTYTMTANDNGRTFLVNTSGAGGQFFTLPAPSKNYKVTFKDSTGTAQGSGQAIVVNPHASETIDGGTSLSITTNYGYVTLLSDGTNWFVVDHGPSSGPWISWTPTINGVGTATSIDFKSQRVGNSISMIGTFTAGTVPSGQVCTWSFPPGVDSGYPDFFIGGTVAGNINAAISMYNLVASMQGFAQVVAQSASINPQSTSFHSDAFCSSGNQVQIQLLNLPVQGWTNY